jgi:hypothetical protein
VNLGLSTSLAIVANKVVPGLLDRYLGRTGYDAQQTSEAESLEREDNLLRPVGGDHGAHGTFDDRARDGGAELWAVKHRSTIAAAALGIGGALVAHRVSQANGGCRKRRRDVCGSR